MPSLTRRSESPPSAFAVPAGKFHSNVAARFSQSRRSIRLFLIVAASFSFAFQTKYGRTQDSGASVPPAAVSTLTPSPVKGARVVNVNMFGAVGDGVANDTAAFDAALTSVAGGGTCLVPKGTYLISATGIKARVVSNVHLRGAGREASVLKIAGMPPGNFLWCQGNDWSVEDLTIDMQDYFTNFSGYAALVAIGSNWRVANCAIVKIGRIGINVDGGSHGVVEKNLFVKTGPSRLNNSAILGVVDSQGHLPFDMRIVNNVCVNSEIYFNGKHSLIAGNRVNGSGFGSNICVGVHSDDISVIGNMCSGGRGLDESNSYVSGFELWATNSVIVNNVSHDNDGAGITMGGNNCIVIGNRCWDNARLSGRVGGSGIVARAHPTFPNAASGSVFIGNSCFDTRWPEKTMTQAYGYNEVGNGLKYISQFENDYGRNRIGATHFNSLFEQPNVSEVGPRHVVLQRISRAMISRLKTVAAATDIEMSDSARRALREYLKRENENSDSATSR